MVRAHDATQGLACIGMPAMKSALLGTAVTALALIGAGLTDRLATR